MSTSKIVSVKDDEGGTLWNIKFADGSHVLPTGVFDRGICVAIAQAMQSRE